MLLNLNDIFGKYGKMYLNKIYGKGETMGTKEQPGPNDCYAKARPSEPIFTLLGRDMAAAATIRFWVAERLRLGDTDIKKLTEAMEFAVNVEAYASVEGKDLWTEARVRANDPRWTDGTETRILKKEG